MMTCARGCSVDASETDATGPSAEASSQPQPHTHRPRLCASLLLLLLLLPLLLALGVGSLAAGCLLRCLCARNQVQDAVVLHAQGCQRHVHVAQLGASEDEPLLVGRHGAGCGEGSTEGRETCPWLQLQGVLRLWLRAAHAHGAGAAWRGRHVVMGVARAVALACPCQRARGCASGTRVARTERLKAPSRQHSKQSSHTSHYLGCWFRRGAFGTFLPVPRSVTAAAGAAVTAAPGGTPPGCRRSGQRRPRREPPRRG